MKFELNQEVYYLLNNTLHSAKILSRRYVDNVNEDETPSSVFQQFGHTATAYATCHGIFLENLIFASKEDLAQSIINS